MEKESEIKDLIKIAEHRSANIPSLLETAFSRGFKCGKDFAKEKSIQAIQQER